VGVTSVYPAALQAGTYPISITGAAGSFSGTINTTQINAGTLGVGVIASSVAVNTVYPAGVAAGTYSNITLPGANVSGNIMSGRLLQRGWPAQRLLLIGFATMTLGAIGAYAVWQGEGLPTAMRFACVVMFSAWAA
jgi:hypothetical protein